MENRDVSGDPQLEQRPAALPKPIEIVCVYAQEDEAFYINLKKTLILWEREEKIAWLETRPGEDASGVQQLFLKQATAVILLLSPDFFATDDCYVAMKAALYEQTQRQIAVVPVLARTSSWKISACKDLSVLPEDERPVDQWTSPELAYENIRAGLACRIVGLVSALSSSLPERLQLFQARDLPKGYVPRPKAFNEIKRKLLEQCGGRTTAITTALRGAGGFGKTTLALALCHDPEIQATFPDGILWVELGEHPPRTLDLLNGVLASLEESSTGAITLEEARERWRLALQDRVYLLVIDDVWQVEALASLLDGGPDCVRLVTTRNDQVLPANAARISVDAMDYEESIATLCEGLPEEIRWPVYQPMLKALVVRLNCWPLLLTLARGMLLSQVHYGRAIADALQVIEHAYEKRGVVAFDVSNEHERQRAAGACLETSLRHLEEFINERYHPIERYQELAIFDEDTDIPLSVIQRFWKETGGLESWETEDLCIRLHMLSLLLTCDLGAGTIRLHDVMRSYLVHRAGDQFSVLHSRFLDAQQQVLGLTRWTNLPLDDRYLWHFLVWHLCRAARWEELHTTLTDLRFLAKKGLLSGVASLEANLLLASEQALAQRISTPEIKTWQALHRRIVQISHLLRQVSTPNEIGGLLLSHLAWEPAFAAQRLIETQVFSPPFLAARHPLPQNASPALLRTFSGHTGAVNSCAISFDGRWIVSASADKTLRVWDAASGEEHLSLKGHISAVNSCAISFDGSFIVSASADNTLKVWDTASGEERLSLKGHTSSVTACVISRDGRWIVSASADNTLKLWGVFSGKERLSLKGHTSSVTACAISPDGRVIVSASTDETLKVWDALSGLWRLSFKGHTREITGCTVSRDGRWIVSASADKTLKVWDVASGKERLSLKGHTSSVTACAISPDGRVIVSASADNTLKVWNAASGEERLSLKGHTSSVTACAISRDGRWIVSASTDSILKVWDADSGKVRLSLKGYSSSVNSCAISYDGRWIVSASCGNMLKVWDMVRGTECNTFSGHTDWVNGCAISPDGRWIVSASADKTLKVWGVARGTELFSLKGHTREVTSCAISPDGRWIVSASADKTLKVWDVVVRLELFSLRGHTSEVTSCTISPDGRWIVSASADCTLKVWGVARRAELFSLKGHMHGVTSCAISPDGRWIVSASVDKTLKVWDVQAGHCALTFPVDGPLFGCTFYPDGVHLVACGMQGMYFLRLVQ